MRIVSLLPSATETLFALGFDQEIVGVSHECDYPPAAKKKTCVVSSRIPKETPPAEIDLLVRQHVERGESIYAVDPQLLKKLEPDLVITQDLCHVCAATPEELGAALTHLKKRPAILSLDPLELGDVWRDILWIGEATGRRERAQKFVERIGLHLALLENQVRKQKQRPRVVLLEWMQPFYIGGHWVPEMITQAGGTDVLGDAKKPSRTVTLGEIVAAQPEVIFIAPCGYDAKQARDEYLSLDLGEVWRSLPAVRDGRVYALDANAYVSRPAGRLVTGMEAMAKAMYPSIEVRAKADTAFLQIRTKSEAHRAASAGSAKK